MGMGMEMMMEEYIDSLIWEEEQWSNLKSGIWTTREGQELQIKDMESEHIRNCIKMLERNIEADEYPSDTTLESLIICYIDLLQSELSQRYPLVDPAFVDW